MQSWFRTRHALGSRRRLAAGVLAALLLAGGACAFAEAGPTFRFTWAVLIRGGDGASRPLDYSADVVPLASGDRLRIYLQPLDQCHLYLYLHDAQHNLFLMFPDRLSFRETPVPAGASYALPGADTWFRLDERGGTEVFYLIVSDHRLEALEAKTDEGREGDASHGSLRPIGRADGVLEEIRRIAAAASGVTAAAEKPVPVAGSFRGLEPVAGIEGISVETQGVYVRTIRLQH